MAAAYTSRYATCRLTRDTMSEKFCLPVRVYYEDTDAGGVVYHANYLGFMERARNEWLRELGYPVLDVVTQYGLQFVLRSAQIDYHAPARLDDLLTVTAEVARTGRTSMVIHQQVLRNDTLLVTAEMVMVVVDTKRFRPQRLPDFLTPEYHQQAADE